MLDSIWSYSQYKNVESKKKKHIWTHMDHRGCICRSVTLNCHRRRRRSLYAAADFLSALWNNPPFVNHFGGSCVYIMGGDEMSDERFSTIYIAMLNTFYLSEEQRKAQLAEILERVYAGGHEQSTQSKERDRPNLC